MNRERLISFFRRGGIDLLIVLALVAAGTVIGVRHMAMLNTGRSAILGLETLYGPSAMLVTGHGYFQPDTAVSPELRAFLRNEAETLDPTALPEVIPEVSSAVAAYHRYLLYTVAAFWWVFGISWSSLELLVALMLGGCAAAAYGIFRLGTGRLFAALLAAAFAFSPTMIIMLSHLRDFSKAPFILAVVFMLGMMIKTRPDTKRLLVYAPILGLLIGIGLGFRQDIIVFIPPACIVMVSALLRAQDKSRARRAVALVLFFLCLFTTARPMLGRMEGGAQPYHPLVQGYSMKRMEHLGVRQGAYQPLASGQDNYVFSMLYEYNRRVNRTPEAHFEYNSPGAEAAGRQWLIDMGIHFPADLITRGYGSVLRAIRYGDAYVPWFTLFPPYLKLLEKGHLAFAGIMHYLGLPLALAAFLLIGRRNTLGGLGLLVFVVYIFGYVGLQCEFRHAFHLSFVPFWIVGFLVTRCVCALSRRQMPASGPVVSSDENTSLCMRTWRHPAFFVACALVMVVVPLQGLRLYQRVMAAKALAPILAAPVAPVTVSPSVFHGWTLYWLEDAGGESHSVKFPMAREGDMDGREEILLRLHEAREDTEPLWHTRTRYLMAELDAAAMPDWMLIYYESEGAWNDFAMPVRLPKPDRAAGIIRYYFPVYELRMPDWELISRNRFRAVGLPGERDAALLGLYEITDFSACRFLLHATTHDGAPFLPLHQQTELFPHPMGYYHAENDYVGVANLAEAAARFGAPDQAVRLYQAALIMSRDTSHRLFIARGLAQLGAFDAAIEGALDEGETRSATQAERAEALLSIGMMGLEQGNLPVTTRALDAAMERAATVAPGRFMELLFALEKRGHYEVMTDAYHDLFLAYPEYLEGAHVLDAYFVREGRQGQGVAFWMALTQERPDASLPWLRLGIACEAAGDGDGARRAYARAYENNPQSEEAVIRHIGASPEVFGGDELAALVDGAVERKPHLAGLAADRLERAADALMAAKSFDRARALYAVAAKYAPQSAWAWMGEADALVSAGNVAEARDMLAALLEAGEREDVAAALDRILTAHATQEERAAFWREQAALKPDMAAAHRAYGRALFDNGDYPASVAALTRAVETGDVAHETALLLRVAQLAAGMPQTPPLLADMIAADPEQDALVAQYVEAAAENLADRLPERAEAVAGEGTRLFPERETLWVALAGLREARGDMDGAAAVYREAIGKAERNAQLALRLDALLVQRGDAAARQQIWNELAAQRKDDTTILHYLGMASEAAGMYEAARDAYAALATLDADAVEVRIRLGGARVALGDADGADMIDAAVKDDPAQAPLAAWVCQNAGRVRLEQGDMKTAVRLYRLAAQYDPADPFPRLQLGNALLPEGDREAAVQAWRDTIRAAPDSPPAREAARQVDRLLNMDAGARITFWRSVADDLPGALLPRLRLGFALTGGGEAAEAARLADALLQAQPEDPEVRLLRGVALCRTGNTEEGIPLVRAVAAEHPQLTNETAEHLAAAARVFVAAGQYDDAAVLFALAAEVEPQNLGHVVALGEALLATEKYEAAVAQFEQVLMVAPESPRSAALFDEAWRHMENPEAHRRAWQAVSNAHPNATLPKQRLNEMGG